MRKSLLLLIVIASGVIYTGCKKEDPYIDDYNPTPLTLQIPQGFPPMIIPPGNPMTVEGVYLGRKLFWEKRLSRNSTQACGSCHFPSSNFSDTARVSVGVEGTQGTRHAMTLINLGWAAPYFWDGRAATLEDQVLGPVPNPIEMNLSWSEAVQRLQADSEYPLLFKKAFGTYIIDSSLVAKAVAQFMRTMISANSRYDKMIRGELLFTASELNGQNLFRTDRDINNNIMGADCFHCHGEPLMQVPNVLFENNGLDLTFADSGRGKITGNPFEIGHFKVPTLRNWIFRSHFMHDGRFTTIDQVLAHYNTGLVNSPNISSINLPNVADGGVNLPPTELADLKAFILTFNDYDFVNNPDFQDPNH